MPALKEPTDPCVLREGDAQVPRSRGQAAAARLKKLFTAGRAKLCEATWLAPGRTAMAELGERRAAPLTVKTWHSTRNVPAACILAARSAPAPWGGKAVLAIERELYSSLISVTGCNSMTPGEAYAAVEGLWMLDKVSRRGNWPTTNQLHMFW